MRDIPIKFVMTQIQLLKKKQSAQRSWDFSRKRIVIKRQRLKLIRRVNNRATAPRIRNRARQIIVLKSEKCERRRARKAYWDGPKNAIKAQIQSIQPGGVCKIGRDNSTQLIIAEIKRLKHRAV